MKKIVEMSTVPYSYKPVHFTDDFIYDNMVKFDTISDGSCFFHALLMSFYQPYQENTIDRRDFVKTFRKDLSIKLQSPVNPNSILSPLYYDTISNGSLQEFANSVPEYKIKNMVKKLNSNSFVGNEYIEFISNLFDRDIYIIDLDKQNVYMTGDDYKLLHKGRLSTVIGYINENHFELIGIQSPDGIIKVSFSPDDDFIYYINRQMQLKINV